MTVVGIDVGGTFTDIILVDSNTGRQYIHKVPSTPASQDVAVMKGLWEILTRNHIPAEAVTLVVHGTTVATNAMLERKGARVALVTTKGLEDVIEIGRQNREEIYSLVATRPQPLVRREDRFGVCERLDYKGNVVEELSEEEVDRVAKGVRMRGPDAVAISLLFSYANPKHEGMLRDAVKKDLPAYVVTSSSVLPEFREFERTSTTILEAYLGPLVVEYLSRLDASVRNLCPKGILAVMQSNGGTMLASEARGNAIGLAISGLAGGAIGGWQIAQQAGLDRVITLDMGGTSCDISAINGGVAVSVDNEVAGLPLRTPSVDVKTIGAGGGSIAWVDDAGILHVGPQSAGAVPGPAAYAARGTEATVTDANLVIGRLNPDFFLGGALKLNTKLATEAVERLAKKAGLDVKESALGIVRISTANMVQAIREVTIERGSDPRQYVLVPFGGAGPTQAVDIAAELGIRQILVPPYPGITSALGLVCTDLRVDLMQSLLMTARGENLKAAFAALSGLTESAVDRLRKQGVSEESISVDWSIDMRYAGQSHELNTPIESRGMSQLRQSSGMFERRHRDAYGYELQGRPVEWVTARVTATSSTEQYRPQYYEALEPSQPIGHRKVILRNGTEIVVETFVRSSLGIDQRIEGPAIIEQLDTTTYVGSDWVAEQQRDCSLKLRRTST
jgi:N-methylhydantoinase A